MQSRPTIHTRSQGRAVSITKTRYLTEEEYRQFALGDTKGQWELVNGQLRERPPMSVGHGEVMINLVEQLLNQLDRSDYRLRTTHARLRRSAESYYIPDIAVIPATRVRALLERPEMTLDAYPEPLPLVVEIWSPLTGEYDVNEKLPEYQARGDLEIWRIHPYERTLTAWRRQLDGTYAESLHRGGTVTLAAIPGVTIDLDALFES
jgi:Uma2 family endonuclease